ncbi:phage major capsid protein [Pseudarthrobacter sp. fls2-241-R2A-127]|uniref:phage major capsid protein n=1 Tax=Pseudarthrobacter sp. fls2-241-R2A-127 TaxID=3040303 RepID=UPI0025574ABD|nr:phage major capsid protein [Pseudarthrobacter sp. fls2-241-R2A-127]
MSTIKTARAAISELSTKASQIVDNKSLTNVEKKRQLDRIEADIKEQNAIIALHTQAKMMMAGADSFNGSAAANGPVLARRGAVVPSFEIPDEALYDGFKSLKGGGGARFELGVITKDSAQSIVTEQQIPPQLIGLVERRFEPQRLLDLFPTAPMAGPSIEFITHSANSQAATAVAMGGTYPENVLTTTQTTLVAQKLAVQTVVLDELLADFPSFRDYISVEITRQIQDAENNALLNGNGTAPQIRGLLNTSGVLTRAAAYGTNDLDTLNAAIADLRSGSQFVEPDLFIIHPSTWASIRTIKDSYGHYLLGNPADEIVPQLWGVPVALTTQIAVGTGILLNTSLAVTAFVRSGVTLEMSNQSGTDFQTGSVRVRAEERLTLGVQRPAAVNIITGL